MKKFLNYVRRTILCMIGLLLAVFINVPLVMLGFPIISIIILLFVGVCKINDYVSNKSLAITDGEIWGIDNCNIFCYWWYCCRYKLCYK